MRISLGPRAKTKTATGKMWVRRGHDGCVGDNHLQLFLTAAEADRLRYVMNRLDEDHVGQMDIELSLE